MLAARLYDNHDLRVEDTEEPGALGPAEARVRPVWCGICGTDLHEYAQGPLYIPKENLPQILGHEFSAQVEEVEGLEAAVEGIITIDERGIVAFDRHSVAAKQGHDLSFCCHGGGRNRIP